MFKKKLGYSADRRTWLLRIYNRLTRIYHAQDLNFELQVMARRESARYARLHMRDAIIHPGRWRLLETAVAEAPPGGLFLEAGVEKGTSINFIARLLADRGEDTLVHGFDSFEGLPGEWSGTFELRGKFSRQGRPPEVLPNVRLHKGWFGETLVPFMASHPGPTSLLHVDCDIYSSTCEVLAAVTGRLVPGSIVVFDEFFNYHNWQAHEARAWREHVEALGLRYVWRGFAARGGQAYLRIL